MKVLVTGATGFIGSHLVDALVDRGRQVRCLIRAASRRELLSQLGVEVVYGDLLDRASLPKCLEGVERVYHLAGIVFSPQPSDYAKINIEGTRNLLRACLDKNIERFVHFSSIAAVGPNPIKGRKLVETDPMKPVTPYGRSKHEAEKLVSTLVEKNGFPAVIVRAPIVFGPRAVNCRSAILFRNFLRRCAFLIGGGGNMLSLIYVKNLVQAAILIEERSTTAGDIFFASDDSFSMREIGKMIASEAGIQLKEINIPVPLAAAMMKIPRLFERIGGFSSLISQDGILGINSDWDCSSRKLREKLGFSPLTKIRHGIRKTVQWYQREKPKES